MTPALIIILVIQVSNVNRAIILCLACDDFCLPRLSESSERYNDIGVSLLSESNLEAIVPQFRVAITSLGQLAIASNTCAAVGLRLASCLEQVLEIVVGSVWQAQATDIKREESLVLTTTNLIGQKSHVVLSRLG